MLIFQKLTLLLILFPFTILLGIIALLLWTRLGFELPVAIIGIVVLLQFLFFLVSVPAFFNEKKYKLLFPLVIIHVIAFVVYLIVATIYIIKFIIAKSSGNGDIRNPDHSIFLPGIPSQGFGDTGVEGMTNGGLLYKIYFLILKLTFQLNTLCIFWDMCCSYFPFNYF